MDEIPVVTVDGPGGTGKGVLCSYLAHWLGWHLLDSGALYRAVAFQALEQGVALDDAETLARVAASLAVRFEDEAGGIRVFLGKRDITVALRTESCGNAASRAAAHGAVRRSLLEKQRSYRIPPGLIADGRDMGTVVFPDAGLKIYLTATPQVRAVRRYKQLNEKGNSVNLARLSAEIEERDARDAGRSISPMMPAPDAIVIDTSELNAEAVCARVAMEVKRAYRLP